MTFGQWRDRSMGVAAALAMRGVGPGSRVALRFGRSAIAEMAVALVAVHRLGAAAVLLPVDDDADGYRRMADASRPDAVIAPDAVGAPPGIEAPTWPFDELEAGSFEVEPASQSTSDGLATVVFTSGTTGFPKGVTISHADVGYDLRLAPLPDEVTGALLHSFPLSVPVGQWAVLGPVLRGVRTVTLPEFDPRIFLALIDEYDITETAMVPAIAVALRDVPENALPRAEKLHRIIVGSARPPQAALTVLRRLFPAAELSVDYNSTEAGCAGTSVRCDENFVLGCVGLPYRGTRVRIVDDEDRPVTPGSVGRVQLAVPPGAPTRSYLDDPETTAATFVDGWVRMGDLGRIDEQGRLHLTGRTTEWINLSGRKVSCLEVERAFEEHPSVSEAAAFAVNDEILGEELCVALTATELLGEDELRRHAAGLLAAHKVPTRVMVVESLPRTRSGKIRKDQLPRMLAAQVRTRGATSDEGLEAVLLRVTREVLQAEEVTGQSSLFDLGASSIEIFRIYGALAEHLGADFDVAFLFAPEAISDVAKRIEASSAATGTDGMRR